MYLVTWITATGKVKEEYFDSIKAAQKRLKFLLAHHNSATLEEC